MRMMSIGLLASMTLLSVNPKTFAQNFDQGVNVKAVVSDVAQQAAKDSVPIPGVPVQQEVMPSTQVKFSKGNFKSKKSCAQYNEKLAEKLAKDPAARAKAMAKAMYDEGYFQINPVEVVGIGTSCKEYSIRQSFFRRHPVAGTLLIPVYAPLIPAYGIGVELLMEEFSKNTDSDSTSKGTGKEVPRFRSEIVLTIAPTK